MQNHTNFKCDICKYNAINNRKQVGCLTYRQSINEYDGICDGNNYFKPIKRTKMNYELTEKWGNGFSLADISLKIETPCEIGYFFKLYKEIMKEGYHSGVVSIPLSGWLLLKTIQNNIPWMIKKGFIQEKKKTFYCLHCGETVAEMIHGTTGDSFFIRCYKDKGGCGVETGSFKTKAAVINNWKGELTR